MQNDLNAVWSDFVDEYPERADLQFVRNVLQRVHESNQILLSLLLDICYEHANHQIMKRKRDAQTQTNTTQAEDPMIKAIRARKQVRYEVQAEAETNARAEPQTTESRCSKSTDFFVEID